MLILITGIGGSKWLSAQWGAQREAFETALHEGVRWQRRR